jgi:hypothetical protein
MFYVLFGKLNLTEILAIHKLIYKLNSVPNIVTPWSSLMTKAVSFLLFFYFVFETDTCYIFQVVLELTAFLLQPPNSGIINVYHHS